MDYLQKFFFLFLFFLSEEKIKYFNENYFKMIRSPFLDYDRLHTFGLKVHFNVKNNSLLISAPTFGYDKFNNIANGGLFVYKYDDQKPEFIHGMTKKTARSKSFKKNQFTLRGYNFLMNDAESIIIICSPNQPFVELIQFFCEKLNLEAKRVVSQNIIKAHSYEMSGRTASNYGIIMGIFNDDDVHTLVLGQKIDDKKSLARITGNSKQFFRIQNSMDTAGRDLYFKDVIPSYSIIINQDDKSYYDMAIPFAEDDKNNLGGFFLYKSFQIIETTYNEIGTLGQYFGYAGLNEDFDNDMCKDILFSAPFYSTNQDEGAVFYYLCQKHKLVKDPILLLGDGSKAAHFGLSMCRIEDVNSDTYEDLAVISPGSTKGSSRIFIYFGGKYGLSPENYHVVELSHIFGHNFYLNNIIHGFDNNDDGLPQFALSYSLNDTVFVMHGIKTENIEIITKDVHDLVLNREKFICLPENTKIICGFIIHSIVDVNIRIAGPVSSNTFLRYSIKSNHEYLLVEKKEELYKVHAINSKAYIKKFDESQHVTLFIPKNDKKAEGELEIEAKFWKITDDTNSENIEISSKTKKITFSLIDPCNTDLCTSQFDLQITKLKEGRYEFGKTSTDKINVTFRNTGSQCMNTFKFEMYLPKEVSLKEENLWELDIYQSPQLIKKLNNNQNLITYKFNMNLCPGYEKHILINLLIHPELSELKYSSMSIKLKDYTFLEEVTRSGEIQFDFIKDYTIQISGTPHPSTVYIKSHVNDTHIRQREFKYVLTISNIGETISDKLVGTCLVHKNSTDEIVKFSGFSMSDQFGNVVCDSCDKKICPDCTKFYINVKKLPSGSTEFIAFHYFTNLKIIQNDTEPEIIMFTCRIQSILPDYKSNIVTHEILLATEIVRMTQHLKKYSFASLSTPIGCAVFLIIILFLVVRKLKLFQYPKPENM